MKNMNTDEEERENLSLFKKSVLAIGTSGGGRMRLLGQLGRRQMNE